MVKYLRFKNLHFYVNKFEIRHAWRSKEDYKGWKIEKERGSEMGAVLEKITLYDILGYLLPGSVLMILVSYGAGQAEMSIDPGWWSDSEGFGYFVFFLTSYLVGIVLSEIMTWVWRVCKWLLSVLKQKCPKTVGVIFGRIINFLTKGKGKKCTNIWNAEIEEALVKSGVKSGSDKFKKGMEKATLEKEYIQYMYGCIQGIDKYKRIHNYASAQVLYKNVAGALFIGAFFTWRFCDADNLWMIIVCIIMGLIFIGRGIRFQKKKFKYTVIWFLEEFNSKNDSVQKGSSKAIISS